MIDDEGEEGENDFHQVVVIRKKKPSLLLTLAESASSTISSSSSSMFRNALFISILFWFSWPSKRVYVGAADNNAGGAGAGAAAVVCDDDDTTCRIANYQYGPPICCITPSFCDAKAHNWIYQQGGTAQAYKPDAPTKRTICDTTATTTTGTTTKNNNKMRHKVSTWPYSRSSRKSPPELTVNLNLLRCNNYQDYSNNNNNNSDHQLSNCCCHPLIRAGSQENATIEIWQTRPDGTYSSLRQGNQDGDCRASWVVFSDVKDNDNDNNYQYTNLFESMSYPPLTQVEFTTLAPGSTGSLGGLGPNGWEFSPYGPPVLHILVRPSGVDGVSPLLVDVPVSIHPQTLQENPFTWRDWRGPAWVKSSSSSRGSRHNNRDHHHQPSYNITSWEADVERNSVTLNVDLFLQEDKEYSISYVSSIPKLMCPSLLYGLPGSFFLEPITVCGKFLLDYFDL